MKKIILITIALTLWISGEAQPWEVVGDTTFGSAYEDYFKHIEMIDDVPHIVYRDLNQASLKIKIYDKTNNVWYAPNDSLIAVNWNEFREYETTVDQDNKLNVIYHNPDTERIIVKKFDGSTWTVVGAPFGSPSNSNYPQIEKLGTDKLVAAFSERDTIGAGGSLGVLSLYEFDGSNWSRIAYAISDTTVDYIDLAVASTNEVYVSYHNVNWELYVHKYDGSAWEMLGGAKADTSQARRNELYMDHEDNLHLYSRNRTSSFNWEFRKWNGTSWDLLESPNHLYAVNGTVINTNNHAMSFNPIDNKFYIAFTTNTSQRSFFKRFDGASWTQVGDSLYADPGYVGHSKLRFDSKGNPFYTSEHSKVMTMDLGLVIGSISELNKGLTIYPNPVIDLLTIEADFKVDEIEIIDLLGKQVLKGQNKNQVSLKDLKKGTYVVKVISEDQQYIERIVKL